MWYQNKFFKYMTGLILTLLAIYLFQQVDPFIAPIRQFIAIIFFPFLLSGLFYYILRPPIRLLEKIHIPKTLSVLIVIVAATAFTCLAATYAGSILVDQIVQLTAEVPKIALATQEQIAYIINHQNWQFIPMDKVTTYVADVSQQVVKALPQSITTIISTITSVATILFIVPFMLFYLLKDDHLLPAGVAKFMPDKYRQNTLDILDDIDKTLSAYIIAQVLVSLVIGIMMYIGYIAIGVKFAFLMAMFAAITTIIPIVGAPIGIIPAVLLYAADDPFMILKIVAVMLIVQLLQGNLISPVLMGKQLDIHPLTFIVVLLVAGSMYGFIGMLIAVPTYAVLKVTLINLYRLYLLRKKSHEEDTP